MTNNISNFEIRESTTKEMLCNHLKERRKKTLSLNKCCALWIREKMFRCCCPTDGMGMKNRAEKAYQAGCVGKTVTYTSNVLAFTVTLPFRLLGVGLAFEAYKKAQLEKKVHPMAAIVPN